MATRYYFPATASNGTGLTPSFDAGWNYTTEAARAELAASKGSSAITTGTQIGAWTATAGQSALDRQWIGPRLAAQTISGTVSLMLMVREYATSDNVDQIHTGIFVVNTSGTKVATLKAKGNSGSTLEFISNVSHRTHTGANAVAISSYSCSAGDRIVVEIGYSNSAAATTPEASAKWGENATDATLGDNATTADRAGWVEFSANLALEPRTGDLSSTLDAATAVSAGISPAAGALSSALDAATLSSAGEAADANATGALAVTLEDVASSSAGVVPTVGSGSPTLDAVSTTGAGAVLVAGATSSTLGAVVTSSAGSVDVFGVSSKTLDDVSTTGAGVAPIAGALSAALDALALSSTDGPGSTSGALEATLDALACVSAGAALVVGGCSPSLQDTAASGAGVVPVFGATTRTLNSATCMSGGIVDVDGDGLRVLDDVSVSCVGVAEIQGALSRTLGDVYTSPDAAISAALDASLDALTLACVAIKVRVPLVMPNADVRLIEDEVVRRR